MMPIPGWQLQKKWRCAFVRLVFVYVSYILCSGMWNIDLKKKKKKFRPTYPIFFSMLRQSNNFFLGLIPWLQWFEPCVSFYYYMAWKETRWYHGIKQILPAYNRVVKIYHLVEFWLIHFTWLSSCEIEKSKLDLVIYFVLSHS